MPVCLFSIDIGYSSLQYALVISSSITALACRRTMPFEVKREPQGVCFRFNGDCAGHELRTAFERLSGCPDVESLRFAIFDYSRIENLKATKTQIEDALVLDIGLSAYSPYLKIVTVAQEPHISSMWKQLVSSHTQKDRHALFSNEASARDWLARCA